VSIPKNQINNAVVKEQIHGLTNSGNYL
jgi:hypothetical protein